MTEQPFDLKTDDEIDAVRGAITIEPAGTAIEPGVIHTKFGTIVSFVDLARILQPCCFVFGSLVLVAYLLHATVIGDFVIAHTDIVREAVADLFSRPMAGCAFIIFLILLVFGSPMASLLWATDRRLRICDASNAPFNTKMDFGLVRSFLEQIPSQRGVIFMAVVMWVTTSNFLSRHYDYPLILELVVLAAATSFFPFLAFLSRAGVERMYRQFKPGGGFFSTVVSKAVTPLTRLTRDVLPYMSVQLAFLSFWAFVLLRPEQGAGAAITDWIWAAMRDANMHGGPVWPMHVDLLSSADRSRLMMEPHRFVPFFIAIGVSVLLYITITSALSPYAVRLGLTYRSFLNRFFERSSSAVEALTDVLRTPSRVFTYRKEVSWLGDYFHSIGWLVICYLILFLLVASCSSPKIVLMRAIYNLFAIQFAFQDAGIPMHAATDPRLMTFMASIVAAYGTVYLAVTSCAFLPHRKRRRLRVNRDGIADEVNFLSYLMRVPFRSWSDLNSVSMKDHGDVKRLVFKFKYSGSLTMNVSDLNADDRKVLLSLANERSFQCRFDADTLALMKELEPYSGLSRPAQVDFDSTIFTIHTLNDSVCEGAFTIVKQLSTRPLSAVYLARDKDGRLVILKQFVTPDNSESSRNWTRDLRREYEMLKSFSHPQVAKVLSVIDDTADGCTYLALEYIDGENLRSLVERQGERSQKTVRRWAQEVALVMKYLHSLDPPIVHRDLTPDNIILDCRGELKIIDFGAAHQFLEGVTGTLIGKQCYIAPEQLRGQVMLESDIYSFGCTLYFLLTGKDPQAIACSNPAMEGYEVDKDLNELIERCTKFDESERIRSFDEVLAILGSLQLESSVVAAVVPAEEEVTNVPAEAEVAEVPPIVEVSLITGSDGDKSLVLNVGEAHDGESAGGERAAKLDVGDKKGRKKKIKVPKRK